MKNFSKITAIYLLLICIFIFSSCGSLAESSADNQQNEVRNSNHTVSNINKQTSPMPNLQAELLGQENSKTPSPLGSFDFKNYTYPFPHGWQDVDSKEFALENGSRSVSEEKIGMSYITTKYGDATGDGTDEAFVILKIDTGGSAIPQVVYVFTWKDDQPELIWHFRTGDRADGGLKNLRTENGSVIIELYGQDRYILGESETLKITGDEEQISFPLFFTRTGYKWNGSNFRLEGKRLTFSLKDKNAPPVENMGEIVEKEIREKK